MEKTLSETKEELIRKNEYIKHNIEEEISTLKGDAARIGKIALIAGGAILLTYLLVKGKKKDKAKKVVRVNSKYALASSADSEPFIVKQIRKYMIIFLASLAKQKLAAYLQKINNKNNLEANTPKTPELQERWS
jgi:tRNA A37 N6-isopentenylltransferase MiaA